MDAQLDAEDYLASLEPVGWRLGLERIGALCAALGHPQHRFASLHVVGTNGKSSVAMIAATLLTEAGLAAGAYVSPHAERWSERVRIGAEEIAADRFAAAVARVAESVPAVERRLPAGERVTQFEAATAAAFVAFAAAGVEVAVIEAGLGGRLDATNVIPSRATALTSVGLDHTEWLGETPAEIAVEKLAVLRPQTALVIGELPAEVAAIARRAADERGARLIEAEPLAGEAMPERFVPYLRRNAAVARALAGVVVEPPEPARCRRALERLPLPGRAELLPADRDRHLPRYAGKRTVSAESRAAGGVPIVLDAAHNEGGARALGEALPQLAGARPVVACLSLLVDKDAGAFTSALGPHLAAAITTAAEPPPGRGRPGARAADPEELAALLEQAGTPKAEPIPDPGEALRRTLDAARERDGVALITGSHYLLDQARAYGSRIPL